MKFSTIPILAALPFLFFSCVSSKKFKAEQVRYVTLDAAHTKLQNDLKVCEDKTADLVRSKAILQSEVDNLNKLIAFLKENNTSVLKQMQDLSVL